MIVRELEHFFYKDRLRESGRFSSCPVPKGAAGELEGLFYKGMS